MQDTPAKQNFGSYYNKKFPSFLQNEFQTEADSLWKEIEQGLTEACKPAAADFEILIALLPKLEVFLTVYGPSQRRREMLSTLFLRLLVEENTTTLNKVVVLRLILVTLGSGNFKDLRLNWKALHEVLLAAVTDPIAALAMGTNNSKARLSKEIVNLIAKVRILYPEESVEEVLRAFRQTFSPSYISGYQATLTLNLFFNPGVALEGKKPKLGREYYEKKVIPELFAYWEGKRYQTETTYLGIFGRIAK